MENHTHFACAPSTLVSTQPLLRRCGSKTQGNNVVHYHINRTTEQDPSLADVTGIHSEAGVHVQPESDSEKEGHTDLLSTFGLSPRHPLRKAVSTTFKAVTDTFKSQAPFLYGDGSTEKQEAATESPSILHADHKPRKFHHMSNSLSRSKSRFIPSLKNRYSHEINSRDRDLVDEELNPRVFSGATGIADDRMKPSPIDVAIPSPTFSNLSLEFPWIRTTKTNTVNVAQDSVPSAGNTSVDWVSRMRCRVTNNPSCPSPPREFTSSLTALSTVGIPNKTWNGGLSRLRQRNQILDSLESTSTDYICRKITLPSDENTTNSEGHECDFQETPIVGSLTEWKQKMKDRNKRYAAISSLNPARSSQDLNPHPSPNTTSRQESASATFYDTDGSTQNRCFSDEGQSVQSFSDFLEPRSAISTDFIRYAVDAIGRRNGQQLNDSDEISLFTIGGDAITAQPSCSELPNITEVLHRCASNGSLQEKAPDPRPGLDRQFSVRSADSVESCAVTSKSQLLVSDNETTMNHHRRGSDTKDQKAKESIRRSLESIDQNDRDFVVGKLPDQAGVRDSTLESAIGGRFKVYNEIGHDDDVNTVQIAERAPTSTESFLKSNEGREDPADNIVKDSPAAYLLPKQFNVAPVTPVLKSQKSRVSFEIPDSCNLPDKASKQHRRPSPCPVWLTQSLIPVPTYYSPTASKRNLIALTPPRHQESIVAGVSRVTSPTDSATYDGFVAARLPAFSKSVNSSKMKETEAFKDIGAKEAQEPKTPPFKHHNHFSIASSSDTEAMSPSSDTSIAAHASRSVRSLVFGSRSEDSEWSGSEPVIDGLSMISSSSESSNNATNTMDSPDADRTNLLPEMPSDFNADGGNDGAASEKEEHSTTVTPPIPDSVPKRQKSRDSFAPSPRTGWNPIKAKRFQ